jgi:SnoaL-like domain
MTADEAAARAAITDVLARYARGLDRRDFAEVADCFTTDATAEYGGVRLEPGVEAIVGHVRGVERLDATTHLFGLPVIEVDGGEARTEIAATATLVGAGRVRVRGLRYRHRFVCHDGRWRIAELVHSVHWAFDVPASSI